MGSICCANPPRDRHETLTKNDTVEDSPELNLPAAAHDDTVDKGKSVEKMQQEAQGSGTVRLTFFRFVVVRNRGSGFQQDMGAIGW